MQVILIRVFGLSHEAFGGGKGALTSDASCHNFSGLDWGIVQWQDFGFWFRLSRFESLYPNS
jgi:hypothetical protein